MTRQLVLLGMHPPKPEQIYVGLWKHYKGATYFVVQVGRDEKTLEPMVAYVSLEGEALWWFRPLVDFLGQVEVGGHKIPRFTPIRG